MVGLILVSALLIWKSGALDSLLGPGGSIAKTGQDPTASLTQAHAAMAKLRSVHVSLTGTTLFSDIGEVPVTGNGDLSSPHKESLSLQFQVPGKGTLPLNERMDSGHLYIQNPTQGMVWKEVTGNPTSQLLPELDPRNNLEFLDSPHGSDDMGNMSMDNITVQHLSVNVDASSYVAKLKADPLSGIGAADATALANANIQVEVWIAPVDHYIHQMRIEMMASQFSWDVTYRFSNFTKGSESTSA